MTPSATTITAEMNPEEASTEGPAVEGTPSGGNENNTLSIAFSPRDFDLPAGSGMLPPSPEEEGASPTASVGEPEETQAVTESQNEKPEEEATTTEGRKSTSRFNT